VNRYKKANDGIHAPEELKEQVVRQKHRTYAKWVSAVAAVLVVAIVAGIVFWPGSTPVAFAAGVIAEAEYPEMAPYPNDELVFNDDFDWDSFKEADAAWRASLRAQQNMAPEHDGLLPFYAATLPQFLGGSEGKNLVYSPLNVYLALAMLAETTGGNSRQQILDLLNAKNIGTLRDRAHGLWNANYRDDGAATSRLASSLWLNENVSFHQDTMDRLAETYYASSYQGKMGSESFNKALRSWLNEQTGGLLEEYTADIEMDPSTILALATTIYFRVKWGGEFQSERNSQEVFHGAVSDVTAEFMHQSDMSDYYWGDNFAAYDKSFGEGGSMMFVLPNEGVSVDDLLNDSLVMDFLYAPARWENRERLLVNFSMPKFDVSSQIDLTDGLNALGVTDVFDFNTADFSPMTDLKDVFLSTATHAARVKVDEQGVEAAAFTVMIDAGAAPPKDEVDFVLDRPFLFAIISETGQILFAGVVNQV